MALSPASRRILLTACAFAFAMPAFAQAPDDSAISAPAHIAYIDGDATLARDGRADAAATGIPLVSGDRLRTDRGRVEVIFGDGSVLDVDQFTSIDFLSDELLRLLDGRARLAVGGSDRVSYRIDTPSGAVRIEVPGEYRVALVGEGGAYDVELVVIRGVATLLNEFGETEVRAGERALARASLSPSYAQAYNSARWDAFDEWTNDRRDERLGTTSARYLPDDIHGYAGDFDRYGDWRYEHEYGYVWYPRVHAGWRPYYHGRWSWFTPWGWTWISHDRWGWPTHHYGRWGYRAGAWFWVPKRRWAAAWVYWASAPGYIGWCPLGWDNRPIFSIVNIHVNGWRGYDPYAYWTVVPRHALGAGAVTRYAVPRGTLRTAVPRWSVESASAPVRPAIERRTANPIYSAGRSYAATRSSPDIGTSRAQRSAVPREGYAGSGDVTGRSGARTAAPRTAAPDGPGVLGTSAREPAVRAARPRAGYRDAGPGGPSSSTSAVQPQATRTPSEYRGAPGRRQSDANEGPRRAPSQTDRWNPGERAVPRYSPPAGENRAPGRSDPRVYEPRAGGVSRPSGARPERSVAQPRSRPPAASPAPSRPEGGPSRAPERMSQPAPPRAQGARAPSRSAPGRDSSRAPSGSGDAPRARPRPQPK